jgi:tetratricopeptide (TPR) repeat protein
MLETVRAFIAERLAVRADVAEVERRHADYYRALAEQADRPLRGPGQSQWAGRLEAEAGNLAAAVRWYLAHDARPLPHLFRVLWLFWFLKDHQGEARSWVDQLLPTADSLDPLDRAELLWTAAVIANEVGDDAAALADRERLAPLLGGIGDPYLLAVSGLVMASISGIVGDFDGALRAALISLKQLRGQDEPFWTALAGYTVGFVETTVGRYDDALAHLTEMRELAERFGNAWLIAASRVALGTLAVLQGRSQEARALLDEGLDLSLAAHGTHSVTLALAAFARLAFAEDDPEQAALLAGAAEGLRRRVGLQAWPLLRRGEAELVVQVRQALGTDRFDEVFAAGARLNRRQARTAAQDRRGAGTTAFGPQADLPGTGSSRASAMRDTSSGPAAPGLAPGNVSGISAGAAACSGAPRLRLRVLVGRRVALIGDNVTRARTSPSPAQPAMLRNVGPHAQVSPASPPSRRRSPSACCSPRSRSRYQPRPPRRRPAWPPASPSRPAHR